MDNSSIDETKTHKLDELYSISSVVKDFQFFVAEKWQIASDKGGSGNTANIGSINNIDDIINGRGMFSRLGEAWFDDYWMNYQKITISDNAGNTKKITTLEEFVSYRNGDTSLIVSKCNKDIEIYKDIQGKWHIRDYGRGLKYEHFTQKENDEKLISSSVIGKFGIGLKDALATFERKNIDVHIKSKHNEISLGKSQKYGFDDLITLHAYISPATVSNFIGTEFIFSGVTEDDIIKSKALFLKFSNQNIIEKTRLGEIISKNYGSGKIYISGVKVAEEENFLFSYNITNLNAQIKKALNRERTNVGRTAYTSSIKSLLLTCQSKEVADALVKDLKEFDTGRTHDELKWIDVQEHAVKLLNSFEKVLFVTSDQREAATDYIDEARESGYEIVTIPTNLETKIQGQSDISGNSIMDFSQFSHDRNENFEYSFINYENLSNSEKTIYNTSEKIIKLIGGKPYRLNEIKVSETMQKDETTFRPADGVWDSPNIIIKRSVLQNQERYIAVLLHELAHCISGASDATRSFENELTRLLGILGNKAISGLN
jgi:hypothetical protein